MDWLRVALQLYCLLPDETPAPARISALGRLLVDTGLDLSQLATAAKQLPDNHQVQVSNPPTDYPNAAAQALLTQIKARADLLSAESTLQAVRDLLNAIDDDTLQMVTLLGSISARLQTDALTNAQLRAAPVQTQDDYSGDALTDAQPGADGVLTFTVPALALVAVDVDPVDLQDSLQYLCLATVDGSAPSATRGWRCRSGQTTFLPVPCAGGVVKVWAPVGVSVSVQGGVRL